MHNAKLENSDRLRRVYNALLAGPKTTLQLIREAQVCAVNSIVAELKAPPNNIPIVYKCLRRGIFEYSITEGQLRLRL